VQLDNPNSRHAHLRDSVDNGIHGCAGRDGEHEPGLQNLTEDSRRLARDGLTHFLGSRARWGRNNCAQQAKTRLEAALEIAVGMMRNKDTDLNDPPAACRLQEADDLGPGEQEASCHLLLGEVFLVVEEGNLLDEPLLRVHRDRHSSGEH